MKCEFFKKCKYADKTAIICTVTDIYSGERKCGHYRKLNGDD